MDFCLGKVLGMGVGHLSCQHHNLQNYLNTTYVHVHKTVLSCWQTLKLHERKEAIVCKYLSLGISLWQEFLSI